MITVNWSELGIPADAEPFADGAVGELFHVPREIAGLPGRKLVFKRVKTQLQAGVDRTRVLAQMRSVVEFRDRLSTAELADLDAVTVWPLAMVERAGADIGALISLIDGEFFVDATPPGRPPGRQLFELQFLCVSDGYFTKRGIDPKVTGDSVTRLALAARLAYALEIVHRYPVVFGDLHLKNAVAATEPIARVLLMDCDSVAELRDPGRVQLHGLGFVPPEIFNKSRKLQDHVTDVYKLGLCIVKILSPGNGATQATDPARTAPGMLDAQGVHLLRKAVSANRTERPQAWELRDYLVRRVRGLIQEPELMSAELSHRVALRGSEIFVRWQQRHGTEVRIFGANGFTIEGIDPVACASGYAIRPPTAGPIDVEVWNRFGPSERIRAGYFDYFELPPLDITGRLRGIMRPPVPDIPALDASMFDKLEPYPMLAHPPVAIEIPTPRLEYPPVTIDLFQGGTRGGTGPAEILQRTHRSANEILSRAVGEAMTRVSEAMRRRLAGGPSPGPKQPPGP